MGRGEYKLIHFLLYTFSMRQIIFFLLASCMLYPCQAAVILIHGSFAAKSSWYRPHGPFYEALRHTTKEPILSFTWSGHFLPKQIIADAGYLVELILALAPDEPVILIAHSNGGNLSAYATLLLKELQIYYEQTQHHKKSLASNKRIPQSLLAPFAVPLRSSSSDEITTRIEACFNRLKQQIDYKKTFPQRPHFISALYLMGTPLDIETFPFDMDIVEHVYNLYSEGDFVQSFAGKRHVPNHNRMVNLHVSMTDVHTCEECVDEEEQIDEHTTINPCHGCLHAPLVGRWLLNVPKLIAAHQTSNGLQDGELAFHHDRAPTYHPGQAQLAPETLQTDQDESDS